MTSIDARTAADVYGLPTYAEKPMPKIVSERPVATWFASIVMVRKPNSSDIASPARIDAPDRRATGCP